MADVKQTCNRCRTQLQPPVPLEVTGSGGGMCLGCALRCLEIHLRVLVDYAARADGDPVRVSVEVPLPSARVSVFPAVREAARRESDG